MPNLSALTDSSTLPLDAATAANRHPTRPQARYYWLTRSLPPLVALSLIGLLAHTDMPALMLGLQHLTAYLPDRFWASATLFGHGSVLLAFAVLAWKKRPDWIIAGACGGVVAALYSRLLKAWIGGPRPAALIPDDQLHIVGERLLNGAFPSGHTATAFLLAGVIFLAGRVPLRIALLALAAATLTGLSRIAVGAHWPVDVIAGAAGGWLSAAAGIAIAQRLPARYGGRARLTLACVILMSSAVLPFVSTGYPLALPFQYVSACLGIVAAARWAQAEWHALH